MGNSEQVAPKLRAMHWGEELSDIYRTPAPCIKWSEPYNRVHIGEFCMGEAVRHSLYPDARYEIFCHLTIYI